MASKSPGDSRESFSANPQAIPVQETPSITSAMIGTNPQANRNNAGEKSSPPQLPEYPKITTTTVENAASSWIDDTLRHAMIYQKAISETVDSTIEASRYRLSQIRDHTMDSLRDMASEYSVYAHMVFGKIKDGVNVAASHPVLSGTLAFGVGILALKKTRRLWYPSPIMSEEALLSRADLKVKELRQSMDGLKAKYDKLGRVAAVAKEGLIRGGMTLKGRQVPYLTQSANQIEEQADFKDFLKKFPIRKASRFRTEDAIYYSRARDVKLGQSVEGQLVEESPLVKYLNAEFKKCQKIFKKYNTYSGIFSVKYTKMLHGMIVSRTWLNDGHRDYLVSNLITLYSSSGHIRVAERIFYELKRPGYGSWRAMIWAYAWHEPWTALKFFWYMLERRTPDMRMLHGALKACDTGGFIDEAAGITQYARREGIKLTHEEYGTIVSMLMRNDDYTSAMMVIENMLDFQVKQNMRCALEQDIINSVFGFSDTCNVQNFARYLNQKEIDFTVPEHVVRRHDNVDWGKHKMESKEKKTHAHSKPAQG